MLPQRTLERPESYGGRGCLCLLCYTHTLLSVGLQLPVQASGNPGAVARMDENLVLRLLCFKVARNEPPSLHTVTKNSALAPTLRTVVCVFHSSDCRMNHIYFYLEVSPTEFKGAMQTFLRVSPVCFTQMEICPWISFKDSFYARQHFKNKLASI